MHPALFPFSQPKTSHQSSKLHPDPDCAVLCRYPMWRPFPSLFRNNWSCHRHSDAAARSHTLDSTCSSGILTPQPPALSLDSRCWISFTGHLQPFPPRTLPKLCGRNPGFPNKTTVCRSLMLAVIPGDVGLFEVPQAGDDEDDEEDDEDDENDEDPSVNGVVGKKRPSRVLCRFFCSGDADLLAGCCLLCDEVSEVLSDDEQMGLCPTEVGDCFLFPYFALYLSLKIRQTVTKSHKSHLKVT